MIRWLCYILLLISVGVQAQQTTLDTAGGIIPPAFSKSDRYYYKECNYPDFKLAKAECSQLDSICTTLPVDTEIDSTAKLKGLYSIKYCWRSDHMNRLERETLCGGKLDLKTNLQVISRGLELDHKVISYGEKYLITIEHTLHIGNSNSGTTTTRYYKYK